MMKRGLVFCVSLFAVLPLRAANWPEHPVLHAVRAEKGPVIDGDLSDAAWRNAPEFTDFTQHDPNDGEPGSTRTSVRIVYDDHAIYFGMLMEDTGRPTAILARRDSFVQSDFVSINLNPTLDRLSGNAFTVTPANVQIDTVLFNDIGEDDTWDGVWESAAKIVPEGWIAEVRVPYSQLRFADKTSHVWGVNITRRTVRTNEWVRIVNTKKGDTGFVSHFADIDGIDGIRRGSPLELVPYAVARSDVRTRADQEDPLLDRREHRADAGLDLKYALTPSLTLTGTINPDFGQVEVDPAVVNLSEFETFYPEKRPFFTEGLNIFRFGDSPAPAHFNFGASPNLFYTRRIGRSPQASPDAEFVSAPSETTILGAAKVTGQLPGGWSLGILDALTDTERARFVDGDRSGRQHVEPMTNYFVARLTKTLRPGSRVGFMMNSVHRRLADELSFLRESALTGGLDGYTSFRDRSWILEGAFLGSRVAGTERAIELTQRASSRYYQRPDAGHVTLDPTRTSLTGWGGRAMLSKATGVWRPNVQVQAYSPGFETNDVGFLTRADVITAHALMMYVNQTPTPRFRDKNLWFGTWHSRNFDGDTIERGVFADAQATLANYWHARAALFVLPGSFSDRLTRGGPIVRTGRVWSSDLSLETDSRKSFNVELAGHFEGGEEDSYVRSAALEMTMRPSESLQFSIEPSFTRLHERNQYVTAFADPAATATFGRRYVFAELEQREFELGTRADWTLSPRLSFQLYLQPFIASGDFHEFHSLAAARTRDYVPYAGTMDDPDFSFRSVRGSAVARWEFRPGSALYVVWNENRVDVAPIGDFRFRRDLQSIPNAPSHDVFLVKLSYWLPM